MEESYIFFNNRRIPLTEEQIRLLKLPASLTPAEVTEIVRMGKAREHFKIHDILTFGGMEFEVIGFNHDSVGTSRPTMTLMGKKIAGKHCLHDGNCDSWADSDLRKWLNAKVLSSLPEDLRNCILPIERTSYDREGNEVVTVDKLFIPSESEVFGSAIYSTQTEGERYEAFDTAKHRVRYDDGGSRCSWWVQSSNTGSASRWCYVSYNGYPHYDSSSDTWIGAPLCFCL